MKAEPNEQHKPKPEPGKLGESVPQGELPDPTLSSLVVSLSAAALTYLGKAVAPGVDKPEPSLPLARHSISTIEMLQAKTAGNRTPDEDKLLEEMLYQLRLTFIKAKEGTDAAAGSSEPKSDTGTADPEPEPSGPRPPGAESKD